MAKNYKIVFKSLRAGTTYTLEIGGGSGTAVQLSGATEPFVTEEDRNEDQFQPIRTQSGSFRIVDNMRDYDGNIIDSNTLEDWWKDLVPAKDSDRPVRLVHTVNNATVVDWHGFMQSQTFSGALYGDPQEREFPVTCPLSVLAGKDIDFNAGLQNFAYLLKEVCDTIDLKSGGTKSGGVITVNGTVHIGTILVQGGADAQAWLLTKIDWQNFAQEDANGILRAKYSLYEVLEDMCRFWGWTARTKGTALYLTAADDSAEQVYLQMNRTQLNTMAGGTASGTTNVTIPTATLADTSANPIFANTNQTDSKVQGPHRAVVKADCNEQDTIVQFAPKDIEDAMGDTYDWVQQPDEDLVGYFTTQALSPQDWLGSQTLKVKTPLISSLSHGAISKRQIYQSAESESPTLGDMLMVYANHEGYENTAAIQLQTLRPMSFGGGSIRLGGTLWRGAETIQHEKNKYAIRMKLGIGMTRQTAKWWYMEKSSSAAIASINCGWQNYTSEANIPDFNVPLQGNNLKSTGIYFTIFIGGAMYAYPAIPVEPNTYGYIFVDIMGGYDYSNFNNFFDFQIANFSIEYSRDSYDIPSSIGEVRPRELKTERVSTKEYAAVNSNDSKEEWNANCIFASDNNMEYGYGLLLDANGNILPTVQYGGSALNQQHPEQHLANRVKAFWNTAKRMIDAELMSYYGNAATAAVSVEPHTKVTIDGNIFTPLAIGRDWRDDIVRLSLLELPQNL